MIPQIIYIVLTGLVVVGGLAGAFLGNNKTVETKHSFWSSLIGEMLVAGLLLYWGGFWSKGGEHYPIPQIVAVICVTWTLVWKLLKHNTTQTTTITWYKVLAFIAVNQLLWTSILWYGGFFEPLFK